MAWLPIAQTVPQYVDGNGDPYSGAVLKFYQDGTSTNTNMATDDTGGTTLSSVALDSNGYPSNGGSVFIPHIDQKYKLSLYPTQAAADSDTGAIWTIDNLTAPVIAASGTDELSKVSSNDTTAGYLNGKLVAGTNISLTEGSDGGNETLTVALTESGTTYNSDILIGQTTRRYKTADESVASSTTLQDDDHLVFAIAANETWIVNYEIFMNDHLVDAGFSYGWTLPSGATARESTIVWGDTAQEFRFANGTGAGNGFASSLFTSSISGHVKHMLYVANGANAGNVTYQWAQGTSHATSTTLWTGSWLVARRVG